MIAPSESWDDNYSTKSTIIQVAISIVANIGSMLTAMTMCFPSVILEPLVESNSPGFHATIEEGSWVASVSEISAPFGCLLGGPLVDSFGRRRGLQILNIANITGWLLIVLVPYPLASLVPLIIGRLLSGFGGGLATCAAAAYISEVATPRLRTSLVTFTPVMMGFGFFTTYLLADLIRDEWTTAAAICLAISAASVILSAFLPESPLWLLERNDNEGALKNLMTVRGTTSPKEVEAEFTQITNNVKSRSSKTNWRTTLKNMSEPEAYKPLIIMIFYFLFQQTSGVSIVIIYGVEFAKNCEIPKDAYTVALFIGVVRVISTFVTTWACNHWGRRIPALTTGAGVTLSLLALTAYVSLRKMYPDAIPSTTWIPAIGILLYIFTSSIGFSSMAWSMLGELYPTNVRGVCSGITSCCAFFFMFLGVKFYPIIAPIVGNIAVLTFFGLAAFTGTLFLAIFLPETHGKTLQDIEAYFRGTRCQQKNTSTVI